MSCRKVTFYNPLLIIYTPLKRPMAPPSVFYCLSFLFFLYFFRHQPATPRAVNRTASAAAAVIITQGSHTA